MALALASFIGLSLVLDTLCASPPAAAPVSYRVGFEGVGQAPIRAWVRFLASAELEGRGTGQRGYGVAARYVASVLQGLGVEPAAADSSYFQEFDIVERSGLEHGRLSVTNVAGAVEEISLRGGLGLDGPVELQWDGRWLCGGTGREAVLSRIAPENSVVFLVPPEGLVDQVVRAAQRQGCRRLVIVSDAYARDDKGVRETWVAAPGGAHREGDPTVVFLSVSIADRWLAYHGESVERLRAADSDAFEPFPLQTVTQQLELRVREKRTRTRNVLGKLVGRDPQLSAEFVGIGAHLDHLGVQDGDTFLGADDNASGVAAALAVAQALVANGQRPRRSVIFMFFAAEEIGLYGSQYFVTHPPFPLSQMVGALSMDMIGRNEESARESADDNTNTLHVVGTRRTSDELDSWLHDVNRYVDLSFEYDMEETVYRRSDHYNFARRGVPVAFFFAGFHPDYHEVSDTVDKLNYDKIYRVSRLVYALSYEIAERKQRLQTNSAVGESTAEPEPGE